MPKVSVVIPTHNRAELLRSAITSVLNQTFQDFEIVIVDDTSQDHTPHVVNSFGDGRIKYLRHNYNKGEGAARNTGVKNAQGEFIAFLDDDDEWLPEKLELQVTLLESSLPTVGCVYTGYSKIEKVSGKLLCQKVLSVRGNILDHLVTENWLSSSTMLLRKECFVKAGLFDERLTFGADYDLWLRIAKYFDFECLDKPLATYCIHGNNVTLNYDTIIGGFEMLLEKNPILGLKGKVSSKRYRSLGVLYCYRGDIKKGRTALRKAIKLYPLGIKNYIDLILTFLGTHKFKQLKQFRDTVALKVRSSEPASRT